MQEFGLNHNMWCTDVLNSGEVRTLTSFLTKGVDRDIGVIIALQNTRKHRIILRLTTYRSKMDIS